VPELALVQAKPEFMLALSVNEPSGLATKEPTAGLAHEEPACAPAAETAVWPLTAVAWLSEMARPPSFD
jgi:hypothetical protein